MAETTTVYKLVMPTKDPGVKASYIIWKNSPRYFTLYPVGKNVTPTNPQSLFFACQSLDDAQHWASDDEWEIWQAEAIVVDYNMGATDTIDEAMDKYWDRFTISSDHPSPEFHRPVLGVSQIRLIRRLAMGADVRERECQDAQVSR
jgi:hypothetical protein